ncbi:MAG: flagellar hook-associated family protein [Zhengella sp.]|uniref:flagellar hook-associated family protein n=1 Tax=Zhengella sp. TaxID=2282762 RepID=UPI001D73645A|nr:flagellar hook-associated family protein [Notoacmeibacter sp.]MCC0025509.1 flagellar hook-associated family protein [Brucellaceae bacterium]
MKLQAASTLSMASALRMSIRATQAAIVTAQQETVTGEKADPARELGLRNGFRMSLERESERLDSILMTNEMAGARMTAAQSAMSRFTDVSGDVMQVFNTALSGTGSANLVRDNALTALEDLTNVMNTSANGEYLFAGVNADAKPVAPFEGSGWQADLDAAFATHFGFAKSDPAAASLTAAQMEDFLDNVARPLFDATGWPGMSSASDDGIRSRIAQDQTAITSVSANEEAFKSAFFSLTVAVSFLGSGISGDATRQVIRDGGEGLGASSAQVTLVQGRLGLVETQVADATERMTLQKNYMTDLSTEMGSVDPYEAATRMTNLLNQLETAYMLTQRVQSLSLVRYL